MRNTYWPLVGVFSVPVEPVTGSLISCFFGSFGKLPPLLRQAYTALAGALASILNVVPPSPATFPVMTRLPLFSFRVAVGLFPPPVTKCPDCARAGTAAKANAISDSTAIMPIFLNIWVFLPYSVGLYHSL